MVATYAVQGATNLQGEISVGGAKNAALPIIAATVLWPGIYTLTGIPHIEDVTVMLELLGSIGCPWTRADSMVQINTTTITTTALPRTLAERIRGSVYLLGALLARTGEAEIWLPGGCNLGPRPIDFHIEGLQALGAEVKIIQQCVQAQALRLSATSVTLPFPSIGATCQLTIAATRAGGETILNNAARDPEVVDLCCFLNSMGARVSGIGTAQLVIEGVARLHSCDYQIIPDRSEAATFMLAAAATQGQITIHGVNGAIVRPLVDLFHSIGITVGEGEHYIAVNCRMAARPFTIRIQPWPGFFTDWHPQLAAFAIHCQGRSVISDPYFPIARFRYVSELQRLGAEIEVADRHAEIRGPVNLIGADVSAFDIRTGAALVLAGLTATGQTRIFGIEQIERGYEQFDQKLRSLGGRIKRLELTASC